MIRMDAGPFDEVSPENCERADEPMRARRL